MAITKLEVEAGRPLFLRSRREPFRLTETGKALYGYAKRLLALRDEAEATLAGGVQTVEEEVRGEARQIR